jgi:5-(carboxyamino)imidazole ribonucleotide synthase
MMVRPGQWLGILGAGQLGRMFCQAAQSMGYRVMVLDPDDDAPTVDIADAHVCAAYDDASALAEMAQRCLAVSTEFENVPAHSLEILSRRTHVMPGAGPVGVAQDRSAEKRFISSLGVPVAPYIDVTTEADLTNADQGLFPGILKAARLGYDGKGQQTVDSVEEAVDAFNEMGRVPCVLESRLDLAYEISVIMARDTQGNKVFYPLMRNVHHKGILAVSHCDGVTHSIAQEAYSAASKIADGLGYHGVLCVEFFVLRDGSLIANEMAPRPHNSGHLTINACDTSQFEQQVRIMAGLPLGQTRLHSPAVMLNLLGDSWVSEDDAPAIEPDWSAVLNHAGTSLHLYGKREPRIGRKMGHINVVADQFDEAVETANQIVELLGLPERATRS